ncbi:MAG TPA: hypothetical protein VNI77_04035 [Nitrososphaera sp.]|nr:hypothetical protein [Nitrososphaera sp.]
MLSQSEFLRRHAEGIVEAYIEGKYSIALTVSQLKDDINLGLRLSEVIAMLDEMIRNRDPQLQSKVEKTRLEELKKAFA